VVDALVPFGNMVGHSTRLRTLTSGRADMLSE
jgi:translation elongation factor EF-G